jgi:hypothetical protein
MDRKTVENWVEGYLRAWISNEPDQIGQLFTEAAVYYTGPFDEPWIGREAIVHGWLGRKDEPGTFSFQYEVLAAAERLGVVQGRTKYFQPEREFANLWVIRFDEQGRCEQFTEWWVQRG